MHIGLLGGIIAALIGIAGGLFGTYVSIRNAKGPLERALMIKASVLVWGAIIIFIALVLFLPSSYKSWLWAAYGIFLPISVYKLNKKISELNE